jgi:hypothetical protein
MSAKKLTKTQSQKSIRSELVPQIKETEIKKIFKNMAVED